MSTSTPNGRAAPQRTDERVVQRPPTIRSTTNWWRFIAMLAAVSVGVAVLIAAVTDEPPNTGFVDGTAVLAFVAAIAAGIERILEVVWARVDQSKERGAWWPLSLVTNALSEVEQQTNTTLTPFVRDTDALLATLGAKVGDAPEKTAAFRQVAEQIQQRATEAAGAITHAQTLTPGSSRFAAIARAADEFTHSAGLIAARAEMLTKELDNGLREVGNALSRAQDVVGAFKGNPARKTMSIALGVPLGILASGALGLNMFSAVLGTDVPAYMAGLAGILATGVIIGLGSNPTHEVIRALQRRREDATLDVPVGSSLDATDQRVPGQRAVRPALGTRTVSFAVRNDPFGDTGGDDEHELPETALTLWTPSPQVITTYVSNRRVRPIRNAG